MATGSTITGLAESSAGFQQTGPTRRSQTTGSRLRRHPTLSGRCAEAHQQADHGLDHERSVFDGSICDGGWYQPSRLQHDQVRHHPDRDDKQALHDAPGLPAHVQRGHGQGRAVQAEQQENGRSPSPRPSRSRRMDRADPLQRHHLCERSRLVQGTYSAGVTVATPSPYDIIVPDNLLCSSSSPQATCGLVSGSDVAFPWWYASMPNDLSVQAAMLSQNGYVNLDNPLLREARRTSPSTGSTRAPTPRTRRTRSRSPGRVQWTTRGPVWHRGSSRVTRTRTRDSTTTRRPCIPTSRAIP